MANFGEPQSGSTIDKVVSEAIQPVETQATPVLRRAEGAQPIKNVESGEKEVQPTMFSRVVFGHDFRDFDRDQFLVYFQARAMGMIPRYANTHDKSLEFTSQVADKDLYSDDVLVVEGIPERFKGKINSLSTKDGVKRGNFDNDPTDDSPAAQKFHQVIGNKILPEQITSGRVEPGFKEKLSTVVSWLSAVDKGEAYKGANAFLSGDLKAMNALLNQLKYRYANEAPEKYLDAAYEMMGQLFDSERIAQGIKLHNYGDNAKILREGIDRKAEQRKLITERLHNPSSFNVATTMTGLNIAYVDVRGLGLLSGSGGAAINFAKRERGVDIDLVVLMDDEFDSEGNVVGNRLQMQRNAEAEFDDDYDSDSISSSKVYESKIRDVDLRKILADRLNLSEQLFGAGVEATTNSTYGGHPGLVASPRGVGTYISPETIQYAISKFYDCPRYSTEVFRGVAKKFAQLAGTDKFDWTRMSDVQDGTSIASRIIGLTIQNQTGKDVLILLSEEDLPLYESVLKPGDISANKEILLKLTDFSEHPSIVAAREERARVLLDSYISGDNAERILAVIQDLNEASLAGLQPEVLLKALEIISNNANAVNAIWNKDSLIFKNSRQFLPDWICRDIEQDSAARYEYSSAVPAKVDSVLIGTLLDTAARTDDGEFHRRVGESLVRILTSDIYKNSHTEEYYDFLLIHTLEFLSTSRIDNDIRQQIATAVAEKYGTDMAAHWQAIALDNSGIMLEAFSQFPDEFSPLFETLDIKKEDFTIEGVSKSRVVPFTAEAVQSALERQKELGFETNPYATILVQIGRPIIDLLAERGTHRLDIDEVGKRITEPTVEPDALIKVGRLLRLGDGYEEYIKVADAVVEQLRQAQDLLPKDAMLRIVRGGFPDALTAELTTAILEDETLTREFKERIYGCYFNQQEQRFYDQKLIRRKAK
jgi:hypothetical protein